MLSMNIDREQLQALVGAMSDLDLARFLYCQEMAGAYLAVKADLMRVFRLPR
jgi:hypothetical protein